jgi:hypothetical protein
MTGLIVGVQWDQVIGYLFKNEGPENAFYYTLIQCPYCLFF